MQQTFRDQTTKLASAFPLKGSGIVNDLLRFDVSGLAANTEYLLSYDTTTGTFAWSTPTDVTGIETLYTADGTIDNPRTITLAPATSLYFTNAAESDYLYFQPNSQFELQVYNLDNYRPGTHALHTLQIGSQEVSFEVSNDVDTVELDPEDPTIPYISNEYGEISLKPSEFEIRSQRDVTVNSVAVTTGTSFFGGLTQVSLQQVALEDFSNGENTVRNRSIGDVEGGFGIATYFANENTQYIADSDLGWGGVYIGDATAGMYHTKNGSVPSIIEINAIHNTVASIALNLSTSLNATLLSRTDLDIAQQTHMLNFTTSGIELEKVAAAADEAPTLSLAVSNVNAITYVVMQQADRDQGSLSYIDCTVVNYDASTTTSLLISESKVSIDGPAIPSDPSLLSLNSVTQGFLPPRMTTAQRDAIATPVAGLMIYNTTTNKLNIYTTTWEAVTSA